MKEGWEIKKLGDICDVLNGLWIGKKEPFVNICVIRNTNFTKDCKLNLDNVAYIDAEVKQFASRKLKVGDLIIEKSGGSEKQPVGRVVLFDVETGDYSFSNFTSTLRVKPQINLNPNFLHKCLYAHYLRGETYKLQSKTTGLHNLDMKGYLKLPIPIPSIEEQEKIVTELDCLSEIIEKKKQQLKLYDSLAQSIFYEMFGNINEFVPLSYYIKGLSAGKSLAGDEECPNKVLKTGAVTYDYFDEKQVKNLPLDYIPAHAHKVNAKDVLISRMNTSELVGACAYVWKVGDSTYMPDRLWKAEINDLSNPIYLWKAIITDKAKEQIRSYASGTSGSMKNISKSSFLKVQIPKVDLFEQQLFASKIEAIEKQKELIKTSIKEVENLLNSRMYYYFN